MDNSSPHTVPPDFSPDDLFSQIETLQRALEHERAACAAAEKECAAKSDLIATVSHEIRTPLGAIISMADLLVTGELGDTQRHYAETLRQSGRGLLAILNGVLDYSKLSAGRFELENVRFDFTELMESVGGALAARARAKGLESRVDVTEGCPAHFVGDPVRLRQVLNNLIDNAVKFTGAGSVTLRAGFGSDGADTILRFEVADTGIGLDETQTKTLFEPYAQGDSSVAARYGGTGLGLSIARRLALLMGGDMGCENVAGQGAMFWFTVRLREAGESGAQPNAPETPVQRGALSGHVLVVEDNDINQMLIAAYLDNFGVTYEIAFSGRAALEALALERFDLVLMDIMMPGMDGIEATRHIQALKGPASGIPVIALTANATNGDREKYLAAGMDGYVSKPVGASDLFAALADHLEPGSSPSAQSA
jgi:CheY-like chemotaxis protein